MRGNEMRVSWLWHRSLAYENIVWFSQDFYETILAGKFSSHEIGENAQVSAHE